MCSKRCEMPVMPWPLVPRAGAEEDVEAHHREVAILVHEHGETVGERGLLDRHVDRSPPPAARLPRRTARRRTESTACGELGSHRPPHQLGARAPPSRGICRAGWPCQPHSGRLVSSTYRDVATVADPADRHFPVRAARADRARGRSASPPCGTGRRRCHTPHRRGSLRRRPRS